MVNLLSFARRFGVLPDLTGEERPVIHYRPDAQLVGILEARRYLGRPVRLAALSAEEFDALLRQRLEAGSAQAMQDGALDDALDLQQVARELTEPRDLLDSADQAPVIRFINALVTEAVRAEASDIHLEPGEEQLVVRLRVDGMLRQVFEANKALAPLVAARVKVMARLDISEKRLPQDGRISLRIAGRPVDVRVATIPTGHGERVVMRLLDRNVGRLDLEHLGLPPDLLNQMDGLVQRPHGIILVTGPTGSGKTTTLYAMLKQLNHQVRNIMTVEDPIEYHLPGVGQVHVNTKVDLTFARGLRAILRQDPDVVMVGEIRDLETARIAVQASLTGHLVFSTLHTNSALGAITRLRDMGVDSYLLAASLVAVLGQRLVRLLCPVCKESREITAVERQRGGEALASRDLLWHGRGCPACLDTGFHGRKGIFELMDMNDTLRQHIHDGVGERELAEHLSPGFRSLRQDGLRLAATGATSLDEVLRVTQEE